MSDLAPNPDYVNAPYRAHVMRLLPDGFMVNLTDLTLDECQAVQDATSYEDLLTRLAEVGK